MKILSKKIRESLDQIEVSLICNDIYSNEMNYKYKMTFISPIEEEPK